MGATRKATEKVTDGEAGRENAPPIKTAVTLSAEANYRLRCACLHLGKDRSRLVEEMILERFAGYHTRARKSPGVPDEAAA